MKLKPIGNRLLVAYTSRPEQAGGIYLPENGGPRDTEAIIVCAGDQVQDPELKPGTRVIVPETGLVEIHINRRPYYLVKESQLLGVLS